MIPISPTLDTQLKTEYQQVTPRVKAWMADIRYLTNLKYYTTSHSYNKQITDRLPLTYVKFDEIQRSVYAGDGVNRVKDFGSVGFDIAYGNSVAGAPTANASVLPLLYQGPEKAVEYYEPRRIIDTFNRANSTSLGFMTTDGARVESTDPDMSYYSWRVAADAGRHWGISGNTAYSYDQKYSTTPTVMYVDTQGLDQYIDFKLGTGTASLLGGFAAFLRYIDNNNFIAVHITNPTNVADSMRIIQRKNGVDTTLSTVGSSTRFNTTNYYRFRMFVNTIYVYDMGTTEPLDNSSPSSTIFTAYCDDPWFRVADATKVGIGNISFSAWNTGYTTSSYDYHTYIDYFAAKGKTYNVGAHQFPNAHYCFTSTALNYENTAAKFAKFRALNDFSISCMIQAYAGGSAVQTIYWLGDSAQLTAIQVSLLNPSGNIRVKVISTTTTYTLTTTTALAIDGATFHHIGVTKSGTELSVTLNGVKDATTVTVPANLSLKVLGATPYMVWGGDYAGTTLGDAAGYHLYNGLISSFALFDYALLTEDYVCIRSSIENGGTSPTVVNDVYCPAKRITDGFEEETKPWLFTNFLDSKGNTMSATSHTCPPEDEQDIQDNYCWMSRIKTDSSKLFPGSIYDYVKITFDPQMANKIRLTTGYEMGGINTFAWEAYVPSTNTTLSGFGSFVAGLSYADVSLGGDYMISSVKITPLTTNNAEDFARLYTINPYWEVDLTDYVVNFDVQKMRDNYDASLPIGATAANNGTITLDNTTGLFTPYNTSSPYYKYLQPDTKLFISVNHQLFATGSNESVVVANEMYADSWSFDEASATTTISFRDYSKFLQESTVTGYISQNTTAGKAITDVLIEAGYPRRRVSYLETFRNSIIATDPSTYFTFQESYDDVLAKIVDTPTDPKHFMDECGKAYWNDYVLGLGKWSSTIVYSELLGVQDDAQRTQTAPTIDASYSPYNQYNSYAPNNANLQMYAIANDLGNGLGYKPLPEDGSLSGSDYSFSFMTYVTDSTVTGTWNFMFYQGNPTAARYFASAQYKVRNSTTLDFRFMFTDSAGTQYTATSSKAYSNSKPHLFTVQKLGTTYTLYIDGEADGTLTNAAVPVGCGATAYSDTFTRADSTTTIGGSWTAVQGTWGIISNTGYLATANAGGLNSATYDTTNVDHEITFTIAAASNGQGVVARYVDQNNFISLTNATSFGTWNLNKRVGGTTTFLANLGSVATSNATPTLRVIGNKVYCYIAGVLKLTYTITDSALMTGTKVGLYNTNTTNPGTTITYDNVTVKTLDEYTRFIGDTTKYFSNFAAWQRAISTLEIQSMYVSCQQTLIPTFKYLYADDQTTWDAMLSFATADVGMFYFDEYGDFKYQYRNVLHDTLFANSTSQYNLDDNVNIITGSFINEVQTNSVKVNINKITPSSNDDQSLWRAESGESLAVNQLAALVTAQSSTITINSMNDPLWPPSGYFKIDNEIVKYEAISGNTFTNLTRGCFGTASAWHAAGAKVREARYYEIKYSDAPAVSVKYPFITAKEFDKLVDIDFFSADGFSARIVVSANTTSASGDLVILEGTNPLTQVSNAFSIAGVPVTSKASQEALTTVTSQNDTSLRRFRKKEITIDSPFIQNKIYAKLVADFVLGYYTSPVKIISLTTTGIPHLQLGDLVTVTELTGLGIVNEKYWVIENSISFDGGLRQELRLHSYVTPIANPESIFAIAQTSTDTTTEFPNGFSY